jgi:serine O-acetyltransferase
VHFFLHKLCVMCWGIHIDNHARIGGGLHIVHFGGIVIGAVQMGSDCSIMHNVTVGRRAGGEGVPVMGDRVSIATGSVVYGEIRIGDGVSIGPLTVVSRDLPARVLAMGNPMRVIKMDYDNSIEIYGVPADAQLDGEGERQSE